MTTKDSKNLEKILEWMKTNNKAIQELQVSQRQTLHEINSIRNKFNTRFDILDERVDDLSAAIQSLLKGLRGVRKDQFSDRERWQSEIKKIREEIRELLH